MLMNDARHIHNLEPRRTYPNRDLRLGLEH